MTIANNLERQKTSMEVAAALKEQAGTIVERQLAELRAILESDNLRSEDLFALRKGLEALRANADSPEALLAYCQKYLLGVDVSVLTSRGYTVEAAPAVDAKTKQRTQQIRNALDALLSANGVLADVEVNAHLKGEHQVPQEVLEVMTDEELELRRSLDALQLAPELKASFLIRAAEARRESELEAKGLATPEERLQKDLAVLLDSLKEIAVEAILNIGKSVEGLDKKDSLNMAYLINVAESPAARIIQDELFRRISTSIKEIIGGAADAFEDLTTVKKIAVMATGLAAFAAAAKVGVDVGSTSLLGSYIVACYGGAALAALGAPLIREYGLHTAERIKEELTQFSQALAEASGSSVSESPKMLTENVEATDDLEALRLRELQRRASLAPQRTI